MCAGVSLPPILRRYGQAGARRPPVVHIENISEVPVHLPTRTLKRSDLADAVRRKVGMDIAESTAIVEEVIEEIRDAIACGEDVRLSSFGTFTVRPKDEKLVRNPKSGASELIAPHYAIIFKPSGKLRARVNGKTIAGSIDE